MMAISSFVILLQIFKGKKGGFKQGFQVFTKSSFSQVSKHTHLKWPGRISFVGRPPPGFDSTSMTFHPFVLAHDPLAASPLAMISVEK